MRGRKPKPTERQIAEGDPRRKGRKKLEQQLAAEPKPTTGLPNCPRHLKGRARSAWNFWSEELRAMGLDKRPDGPMLEGACRAYERAVKADLIVDQEGMIIQDRGMIVRRQGGAETQTVTLRTRKHPAVEISNRSWTLVRAFCSEFGLSPVSRTRLHPDNDGSHEEEDLLKLLSMPREKSAGSPLIQ